MTHKKTVLIDADIVTYSVGFAAQNDPVENALHSVKIMIRSIIDNTGADSYRVFLTGKDNYRDEIATLQPYKGNRKGDKPKHYDAIREYLIEYHDAEVIDGMEADDKLGIEQTKAKEGTTIIASLDKDLDMIAGEHYNWRKQKNYTVQQFEADKWFMKQLLMGDRTDNIRGIDGIGDKRADRIIQESESMTDLYWKILELYALQHDKPYEAMMENANLLWIMRKEGELWDSNIAEFADGDNE